MSTGITTALDRLFTITGGLFPNHKELVNPYFPEINDEISFEACYGIAVADGFRTDRVIGCQHSVERNFVIILTRKIVGSNLRTADALLDRRTKEKLIFEDQELLINEVEKHPDLNSNMVIAKTLWESDGGLEFYSTEKTNLILIRSVFSLEYFNDLV